MDFDGRMNWTCPMLCPAHFRAMVDSIRLGQHVVAHRAVDGVGATQGSAQVGVVEREQAGDLSWPSAVSLTRSQLSQITGITMAGNLHVRNLDDDLIRRLKQRAARHGRSAEFTTAKS